MLFSDLQKQNKKFRCDNCNDVINSNEIKLVSVANNIQILTPGLTFKYVDDSGKIMGGSEQPNRTGDKLLACPHCNSIHLFGMTEI